MAENRDSLTLNEKVIDRLVEIVRRGNFRKTAADELGIPPGTFNSWLQRGKRELRDYAAGRLDELTLKARLIQELARAESRAHADILRDVVNSEDVRAKMWFLERRYNKQYSKNPNAHIDDETGEQSKVDALQLLAEALAQISED